MSEAKHTQGRWIADIHERAESPNQVLDRNGNTICFVATGRPEGESDANTRLIALVPEMREALLSIRRLRFIEHRIHMTRFGSPERDVLLRKSEAMEAAINTFISAIANEPVNQSTDQPAKPEVPW